MTSSSAVRCVNCDERFIDIWEYKRHQDDCAAVRAERRRQSEDGCTLVADETDPPA